MTQPQYKRNWQLLGGLVLLALTVNYLYYSLPRLTGAPLLDGAIGVILGLYICSHPAANAVDFLFFGRGAYRRVTSGWSGFLWLALNLLVMVLGCLVIGIGVTRLVG